MQNSLFSDPLADLFAELDNNRRSRWYQRECIESCFEHLENSRSTLTVMATGLGKTFCFSEIAHRWDKGPVLVLAHRDELITQAQASLQRVVGSEFVDVEQAQQQSSFRARYVVGSVQSVMQKNRLERLGHERFSLIIVDEAHHATASSYRKILDWFGPAKVAGFTATPDRSDEKAMGLVFDTISYVFDIEQGIEEGYLVPIKGRHVDVSEVDLSGLKSKGGDLSDGELDDVMVRAVAGIVNETLKLEPDRQAVAFFPGIKSAELAAQTFNEKRPGSACYVDGSTDKDLRRELLRDFKAGRFQYFCNCGIATEGFDAPSASLVIHGRPTKSRALYAQITGRGTRVLPGLVDHLTEREQAEQRRALIAGSAKPDLVLMDFVANSGRHDLVTPEDLLGGDYSEEEIKLAKKKAKGGGAADVNERLASARAELKRLAEAAKVVKTTAQVKSFDPFRAAGITMAESTRYSTYGNPTPEWLKEALKRRGLEDQELQGLSARAAFKLNDRLKKRQRDNLATLKQSRALAKYGVDATKLSFDRASEALNYISASAWRPDPSRLHAIVERARVPGED